jgi:hypothetical protein
MMVTMRKLLRPLAMGLMLLGLAGTASAQDDDDPGPDARLLGFRDAEGKLVKADLSPASMGGTWALFVISGVLCVGVMFKSGKRTHLD